jgi:glyoxylase-like metal-dependent hydrolase (beta-lactamase superfamily II)
LGADGVPAFPNARVFVAADEAAFWYSDRQDWTGSRVPVAGQAQSTATARKFLSGVGDRLQRVPAGRTLLPGMAFLPTPGHTPGHQAVRIMLGGDTLLHVGDAVHQYAIQFPRPDWSMAFDTHPAQAVTTRRALFAEVAAQRTRVLGYHLPFPGLGHVRAVEQGYAWVPEPWVM